MYIGISANKADGLFKFVLDHKLLRTHMAVLGSTGSGKTGLILNIVEELNDLEIPVILVDIKGDLINFALQEKHRVIQCITPGGGHGESVDILADLNDPSKSTTIVSALLTMIGEDPDPLTSKSHSYIHSILNTMYNPSLHDLIVECQYPSLDFLGAMSIEDAMPKRTRIALARKLNTLLVSPSFKTWQSGSKLNIDSIINNKRVAVYAVSHLVNKDEQAFAVAFLMEEVLRWTKAQTGSSDLRLVVCIDECVGLLPPYPANPPTKDPILRMLKQARAFGVGMILGTQNPVDIDYKALSNCNTWCVGRMPALRDRSKVVGAMSGFANVAGPLTLDQRIATLKPREFIVVTASLLETIRTRDSACRLIGPMVPEEIVDLYERGYLTYCADDYEDAEYYDAQEPDKVSKKKEKSYLESLPNGMENLSLAESAIGLGLLALFGYAFMQIFELLAHYLRSL